MTQPTPPADSPDKGQTPDSLDDLDQIQQEVARRIADNRRFLETFMDLAADLDGEEDEDGNDGENEED